MGFCPVNINLSDCVTCVIPLRRHVGGMYYIRFFGLVAMHGK